MATYYDSITDEQRQLIENAPLFFIASAYPDLAPNAQGGGPVNVSPKGGVPLVILDANHVAFLDYVGSGNETARHARAGGPVTVMVCSFDEHAAIIRLYGHARVSALEGSPLAARLMAERFPDLKLTARQVI